MREIAFALVLFSSGVNAFEHAGWDTLLKKHVVLLEGGEASRLAFLDYDWSLNDSRSSSRR